MALKIYRPALYKAAGLLDGVPEERRAEIMAALAVLVKGF